MIMFSKASLLIPSGKCFIFFINQIELNGTENTKYIQFKYQYNIVYINKTSCLHKLDNPHPLRVHSLPLKTTT